MTGTEKRIHFQCIGTVGDKMCSFSKPVTVHQRWWKVLEIGVGGVGTDDNMCISTHTH